MTQSERQKQRDDEGVVKELCVANGVSYENIAHDGLNISSLEVFFSGFPRMVGLSYFPRLCQLTIVGQNVSFIEGLEFCPLLQELWVVQCQLTGISGLQNCMQLEKLYLYDNKINEINNLEFLFNLQVLWLNNNGITDIQGLSLLENLKELNLADNNIEKIGHSLDLNVNLQHLNLSGNKIKSFKELTFLACLPDLIELLLKDPMSAPNPVCLLCNYATHVLYHIPSLMRLDTNDVSGKQVKDIAESTVIKKIMYYKLRVRTVKRNLATTQARLLDSQKTLIQLPVDCLRKLTYALKELECELAKLQMGYRKRPRRLEESPPPQVEGSLHRSGTTLDHNPNRIMEHKILGKVEALKRRLAVWSSKMEEIEAWYQLEMSLASNTTANTVHFLLLELQTVGNIRLEEGCPTDPWFTSFFDLLLSRFSHLDYKSHGISGIKINGVFRLHNHGLRLRFEEKLHTLIASKESAVLSSRSSKHWLEHLFYIPDPEQSGEVNETLYILEEGFKPAEWYKASGREGGVPFSNSLIVAEQPRMEYAVSQASQSLPKKSVDPVPFRRGHVIVSKVFIGFSVPVQEGAPVDRNNYPVAHSVYANVKNRSETSEETLPPSFNTDRSPESVKRQRQWFVFDHELVLPECIIYFEYISEEQDHSSSLGCGPYSDDSSCEVARDKDVLGMEPVLKPHPKLLSLDDKTLLSVARANILGQITVLNLHGNSLKKLNDISCLTALRHLTISFNKFTHLDEITHMPNLEFLDVSYNHLVTLHGLRGLHQLKQLDLRWNKLTKTREDMNVLRKHTPALLKLDSRFNPWNRVERVRVTILGRLTNLTHLDNVAIAEEEAASAVQIAAGAVINKASLLAHSRIHTERPRGLSLLSAAQLLCQLSPAPWDLNQDPEPGWPRKITALNLDSQRISKILNLDKLVNLRWASFNDNDICKVEGLDSCVRLEELSFSNNRISTLNGLSKLHCLKKLSVDGNQLSRLDPSVLDQLPNLDFLSAENNCITSLHGIQRARSLLELYVSGNNIGTTKDIYHLKGLTNLIILDLYRNPLVEKLEMYRLYVVFQLPFLKALDGVAVEMTEFESAKDVFGGRLTPDMLTEKLGHSNYNDIIYLTLQSCSIRMVDLTPADLFHNLQSVNLENNNLTSFSGLVCLPNIKVLCLNYNHIRSILHRQKAQAHLTNRQILYHKVHSSGYGQRNPFKGHKDVKPTGSLEPLMGSLEVLHLSYNGISDMANLQLSRLTNLKALFLQGNEISHVEGLEGLCQLRELVLDRNQIKVLWEDCFTTQNVLLELHLADNRIRELNHLQPLTELRKLVLDKNKVQDIAELEKLDALPSLSELSVVGNPVARRSLHRPTVVLRLSRLQVLDGVIVTMEERTKAELLSAEAEASCSEASLTPAEIYFPGLQPAMPRNTSLRVMGLSGGIQNLMHAHDLRPCNVDETQPLDTCKCKKPKHSNLCQSNQAEVTTKHCRRKGSGLPNTGLFPHGNRVVFTYPRHDRDFRFSNGGKPPPL
ncbi:leucine-rich repeat-containing protein 9 [Genypterus blacodes]|uniref:leucine-rich repeat-containing protein 9 n=1 Tax=Genypterus blacodes TaxID=154954 RepID=UPI003F76399E